MLAPSWSQELPRSFLEALRKFTGDFPEGFREIPGGASSLGVFLGLAEPWVGLSWLDPAAGFFLPVLVLTFGKLSPKKKNSGMEQHWILLSTDLAWS